MLSPSGSLPMTVTVSGGADASLRVYDLGGRLVRTLVEGVQPSGERGVTWDGRDNAGGTVADGIYVCRLAGAGFDLSGKITRAK